MVPEVILLNYFWVVKLGKERGVNGQFLIKQLQKCLSLKVLILEVSVCLILLELKKKNDRLTMEDLLLTWNHIMVIKKKKKKIKNPSIVIL